MLSHGYGRGTSALARLLTSEPAEPQAIIR